MTPELSNALAKLAQQLGTTAEHVFPLLVAKAKFDAAVCAWGFGIAAILGICLIAFLIYAMCKWDWDKITVLPIGISALIVVLFSVSSLRYIGDYRYPEATAITKLTGAAR